MNICKTFILQKITEVNNDLIKIDKLHDELKQNILKYQKKMEKIGNKRKFMIQMNEFKPSRGLNPRDAAAEADLQRRYATFLENIVDDTHISIKYDEDEREELFQKMNEEEDKLYEPSYQKKFCITYLYNKHEKIRKMVEQVNDEIKSLLNERENIQKKMDELSSELNTLRNIS